jgi:hypothetical protein
MISPSPEPLVHLGRDGKDGDPNAIKIGFPAAPRNVEVPDRRSIEKCSPKFTMPQSTSFCNSNVALEEFGSEIRITA